MRKKIAKSIFIYLPLFWFLFGFVLLPLLNTVFLSFNTNSGISFANYLNYITSKNGMVAIKNTFMLGVSTVLVCGFIGTTLAVITNLLDFPFKKLINILLMSPMMLPGVLIVISFIQLYGESGLVTNIIKLLFGKSLFNLSGFNGILFIHAYTQYVYFYINVSLAMSFIDSSAIEAARGMGASKFNIFKTIIFPNLLPAIFSSSIITFISGISSFSAPNLIGGGYKVLSTQIMYSKVNNHMNIASMQVVLLMLMGISTMLLMRYFEKKSSVERNLKSTPFKAYKIKNKGVSLLFNIILWLFILMIILPIIATVFLSFVKSSSIMTDIFPNELTFDNYIKVFTKKRVLKPFINSITMTLIAIGGGILITVPSSYLVTKMPSKLNAFLETLIMLPMTLPASSIAINLINAFNSKNIFSFGKGLIGTFAILPIAYITVAIPLLMRTNNVAMGDFNINLEYASKSLGAGKITTFTKITTPLVMPSIISGSVLIFIRTIGEYTISAFLYGIHNQPLSIAMVSAIQEYDIGLSMAYGSLTILICFIGVVVFKFTENYGKYKTKSKL